MTFTLFLTFLLNHIIFDFAFQGEWIIKKRFPTEAIHGDKTEKKKVKATLKGNFYHASLHLLGMIIVSLILKRIYFFAVCSIFIAHFCIDEVKSIFILYKQDYKNNIWIFIIDQVIHFLIIFLAFKVDISYIVALKFTKVQQILITILVFLIVTLVTGIFIRVFISDMVLNKKQIVNNEIINTDSVSKGAKNGGFIIGILERILIFISMLIDYYSVIGFILTAKSIARFNKLSDQDFAEYFIIGNLISFTSAIIGGIFIKLIWKL